MTTVNVTKTINVSANQAWNKLSAFSGIEHFSPIARSVVTGVGVGAKRTCYMPDGAEINEEMLALDNDNMTFQYNIITGPFPFTDYISDVSVKDLGNNCEVTWSCTMNVTDEQKEAMVSLLEGFYNAMIDGVEKLITEEVSA